MKKQQTKQQIEKDPRIKTKPATWWEYLLTFAILLTLSAGQSLIFAEYTHVRNVSPGYIFGMIGYWAIVSAIFVTGTAIQKYRAFDQPMQKLGEAAKQVAEGDFSIYLPPIHTADNQNYIDVMIQDFNTMVEELGSIETLKNDFIASVSHEIKTPLSVIQSYAVALQKEDLAYEKRKEYTDTIINSAKNLTTLVTNILKLNKLGNQEIHPAMESFDVCRQLCDCILTFESTIEQKGIEFVAEMDDYALVKGDASMLEIVWHNLLSNALKFTEPGGKITLIQSSDDNSVIVSISDNGCGMDDKTVKHIFDQFYQGDTSHSEEGNGLGLALVQRVIDLVDGTISVISEPGKGTTFSIRLNVPQ